ncbi:MAG: hypothetical protein ABIP85_27080 [Chthoniobacteraceae bacterium]
MNSNAIHDEIRRTRDALMRECGGDVQRLGDHLRAGETRWAAEGHPVVSFEGLPPMELPLPDWEKIDAEPENEIISEIRATRRKLMVEREAESLIVREELKKYGGAQASQKAGGVLF